MKKAKEAFEGEEQRALKSGKILDEVKASYKTIVQNLQLQLLTMTLTKSTVESIIDSGIGTGERGRRPPENDYDEDGKPRPYLFFPDDESVDSNFRASQGNLYSLLIGSLGKLVNLSSQLKLLCGGLSDKVKESGKPVTGSADLSKINSLFADVKREFSYSNNGLILGLEDMLDGLRNVGGRGVPAVERLIQLYGVNMSEAQKIIERLQRNEYETNIESVFIPSQSTNPVRRANVAAGTERREFTGEEYRLLVQLRDQGLLRGDDFTSVYSGYRDDESTVASSSSGRSRSSRSSGRVRYVPRYSRRGYEKEGDSPSSSSGEEDSGTTYYADEGDSDDDTGYSGSGLYSIPASHRFPLRIH
jgi:hypothetical protein